MDQTGAPAQDAQQNQPQQAPFNINTGEAEKALIKKNNDQRNVIQRNRAGVERQWLVNIAFLYGQQHFAIERGARSSLEERIVWEFKNLEKSKKSRRTVNYILPLYRTLLSRMLQFKQQITVDPETRQERDICSARVAQEALEDFHKTVNRSNPRLCQEFAGMMNISAKLFQYMLTVGKGYLIPIYNPNAKAKVVFPNLPKQPILNASVGAVEVEVEHPFNVFSDPMRQYKIHKKILSVDEIEDLYGVKVEPEEVGMNDVEKQLMLLLEGGSEEKYKDSCEVLIRWQLPSKSKQDGEYYVHTANKILLPPSPIPSEYRGRIPFFDFNYLDFFFGHPQGVVEQLIPSQEEYNHTVSRLHDYKKFMTGKVLVPDGCELSAAYNDNVGQLIKYNPAGGRPEFDVPPGAPNYILRELDRIRRDMEDIASAHDNYAQKASGSGKSGEAIQNLSELDNSTLSPQLIHAEQQFEFFYETVLDIMEAKYSIARLVNIAGKDLASEVRMFKGDDVAGNRRIKVSMGSTLPTNRQARQTMIMGLAEKGYITKEKATELMEFGDLDGVYRNIDDSAEKAEVQEMLKGVVIEPQAYENHARRIKILTDFMMGDEFVQLRKLATQGEGEQATQAAAIIQLFEEHRAKHQQFLSAEMAAMIPQAGGPAKPGAPAPKPAVPGAPPAQ